jgi:hypothetical protein
MPILAPLRKIADTFINLNASSIVFNVIGNNKEIQKEILDLNRITQLFLKGEDSKGVDLNTMTQSGFGYSQRTIENKRRKNLPTNRVTLFDTGKFYKSFRLVIQPKYMDIVAQPNKGDSNLFDDFGDDIVGLSEDSLELLRSKLLPLIIDYLRIKML